MLTTVRVDRRSNLSDCCRIEFLTCGFDDAGVNVPLRQLLPAT